MQIKILSQSDLKQVLDMKEVVDAVEAVYRTKADGNAVAWPLVEHHFDEQCLMDIRSGGVFGEIGYHGAKMLNNFPPNADKGLPVFTGVLMTFDSTTGIPQGVMDASYITCMRTGAAGAVSTRALARKNSESLLMVGAGRQAFFQIGAVITAMPNIRQILVHDPMGAELAERFLSDLPERLQNELGIGASHVTFAATADLEEAVSRADAIITITRATAPLIKKEWVKPGTHLSCIGADMVGKEEIDPQLFTGTRVFCDDVKQCCAVGESEIPFKTGVIREEDFAGEIGQVLNGQIEGRTSDEDITIFDATGLAALDLATAKVAITAANEKGLGQTAEL